MISQLQNHLHVRYRGSNRSTFLTVISNILEMGMASFKVPAQHVPGKSKEDHENLCQDNHYFRISEQKW
jgi:hypothetical protein